MQYLDVISKTTQLSLLFPRQTIQYHSKSNLFVLSFCIFKLFMGSQSKNTEMVCHQGYALISNAEEAEVGQFYEDLQDLLELTPKKRCPFHHRGLKRKSRKSRDTLISVFLQANMERIS